MPSQRNLVRSRAFCFTINNYEPSDIIRLQHLPPEYLIIYEPEVGEQGTRHLQGFISHRDDLQLSRQTIERLLGGRAFLEPSRGQLCSIGYCAKEGNFWCNWIAPPVINEFNRCIRLHFKQQNMYDLGRILADAPNCNWDSHIPDHIDIFETAFYDDLFEASGIFKRPNLSLSYFINY